MSYDTWKLRSDMDEADHSRTPQGHMLKPPVGSSLHGPCVRCAVDEHKVAVSVRTINGERVCELHHECETCGKVIHDRDIINDHGKLNCQACYDASVERTKGDDDAELDGISEGADDV